MSRAAATQRGGENVMVPLIVWIEQYDPSGELILLLASLNDTIPFIDIVNKTNHQHYLSSLT